MTGQILKVDGGKNLTIRGQRQWNGMPVHEKKVFEVGESSSFLDFVAEKF
jgi:hypothetical protein